VLASAHQGYIYQDILGAYFIAQELAEGKTSTEFNFDHKKTSGKVSDKFDDLAIYQDGLTTFFQVKYSNDEHRRTLTKQDFSSSAPYDLALFDLFETWEALHLPGCSWRVCLAWDKPKPNDPILEVITQLPDQNSLLPETTCYQFDCDKLWPKDDEVLSSWRALKAWSKSVNRKQFEAFLDCLIIEVEYPKSSLLQDYSKGLESLLARAIKNIGIGVYPNDHLNIRQVAESLCTIAKRRRATKNSTPISCNEIAQDVGIIQDYGGIEQNFPVDESLLVDTPKRVDQVLKALEDHNRVILTAEPGSGKSWFIENLEKHLPDTTKVVKHYCYTALGDPLSLKRITTNVLYGSLITQILKTDQDLGHYKTKRFASNLDELNRLLDNIEQETLLIVDGIDHIWRVYQKNRGGITEDETAILEALAKLNCSNPNVSLLVVSQPIEQLEELTTFNTCPLDPLPEEFVKSLLEKHALQNYEVNGVSLSQKIHLKSEGNALYIKYLIDHALKNKAHSSFEWITFLPTYDFNLTGYYQYLYDQILEDAAVPYVLCGADFSLTENELREITHRGNIVATQLEQLKPILNYKVAHGYSIYHESFKRFIIDTIKDKGASIEYLVYRPLIEWLETHSFFKSTKAFGHLLQLYYEVESYAKIAETIAIDFIDKSLYSAQPFHRIQQNHDLQRISLKCVDEFTPMIIIAEQSKIIYELDHVTDEVLVSYLNAIESIHGKELMYRVLWDGEQLLISSKAALKFLAQQAYNGVSVIHWDIVSLPSSIPYEIFGYIAIKLLHTKQYEKLDVLIKRMYENPEHREIVEIILDEIDWWNLHIDDNWTDKTPYFQDILSTISEPSVQTLDQAVEQIISNEGFAYHDDWKSMLFDLVSLTKSATQKERDNAVDALSDYNWFRNWLIYLIKIAELSQREYRNEELLNAFSYLVRDLEPFKGNPRTIDLYHQLPYIKKSFHKGLLLCNGDQELLKSCIELLEKVIVLTTSMQRSYSGPLKEEEFLELIENYLPSDYVLAKYEKYYDPLGSRRVYSDIAEIGFKYARILNNSGKEKEANEKYEEGIQALTAYGFRKDRTLSEILYSSVPFQEAYGTLTTEWFYDLYHMAMTVVTHTDGKSTSSYPIEWFKEFIKVFPADALNFLVSETLDSKEANWYQESEFLHILEEYPTMFTPTQWFLLCRSMPLASSENIIHHGLDVIDDIDESLQEVYHSWLQSLPQVVLGEEEETYSSELATKFEKKFGTSLSIKEEAEKESDESKSQTTTELPTQSLDDVLAFLEANDFSEQHASAFGEFVNSVSDLERKKTILRQAAQSLRYGREVGDWVEDIFEVGTYEWLYFNVCLFVYLYDGWLHRLNYEKYLQYAFNVATDETLEILKEIVGRGDAFTNLFSCNLISALSELEVEEKRVRPLLQTTFELVNNRLPHQTNLDINQSVYEGLEGFSRDEIFVALLIARLKTLTTEKTQGIIWSLTNIADAAPELLYKPYFWAFSNSELFLPIHRALLLQILKKYVDQDNIPNKLIGVLLNTYPTGFFLEDQYIRSFVDYNIELDESSAISIQHEAHSNDSDFFPYIHVKYRAIDRFFGPLNGTYNAYIYKRNEINRDHDSYYSRTEQVMTPIVSLANASYEIINGQFYDRLKVLTTQNWPGFNCNLDFFLPEIILQAGAKTMRPSSLPIPVEFPSREVQGTSTPLENEGWILLASREKELYGEASYGEGSNLKKSRSSSLVLTVGENPNSGDEYYSKYLFRASQYFGEEINRDPLDQPICMLEIVDTLERLNILYISPCIIRELGLTLDPNLHNGFQAKNDKGEAIIKIVIWKEDYFGRVSDGTEVPRLEGTGVIIRKDYYDRLIDSFEEKSWFVLRKDDTDANN
jgi:hypothetical protein